MRRGVLDAPQRGGVRCVVENGASLSKRGRRTFAGGYAEEALMEVREVRSLDRGRRVFGRALIHIENLEPLHT